jgi:hypothetical protein
MLYGTILSPILIILGYDPLIVVPSILFSQAIGGFISSIRHHQLKNANFNINRKIIRDFQKATTKDLKVFSIIASFGIIGAIIAVIIAISIPKIILETYISTLVLLMGIILLLKRKFKFSWKKIFALGAISSFNKAISGGGFGPVVTSGQLISGRLSKESIATTTLSEVPICIVSFLTYLIVKGLSSWNLVLTLTIGAIVGAMIGPCITTKFHSEKKVRVCFGIFVTLLGVWTLVKTWLI